MRRLAARTALALALALMLTAPAAWAAQDVPAALDRYCTGCHNPDEWAGGFDLTILDSAHVSGDNDAWEKVGR